MSAVTFLFSTRSRTFAVTLAGSDWSSTWISWTGWQARPPRELRSFAQTCSPGRAPAPTAPMKPEKTPVWPRVIGGSDWVHGVDALIAAGPVATLPAPAAVVVVAAPAPVVVVAAVVPAAVVVAGPAPATCAP